LEENHSKFNRVEIAKGGIRKQNTIRAKMGHKVLVSFPEKNLIQETSADKKRSRSINVSMSLTGKLHTSWM
jgi:hypothetical protein